MIFHYQDRQKSLEGCKHVILSAAKNLGAQRVQILRYAQNDMGELGRQASSLGTYDILEDQVLTARRNMRPVSITVSACSTEVWAG